MSIKKYDPFRDLRSLQDDMNRIFKANFPAKFVHDEMNSSGWSPNVDIYENNEEIILEAELPGIKREEFDVSIENNTVTIKGERQFEKDEESDSYHRVERAYGTFSRSFNLPKSVSAENTKADFSNGVLRVTLPIVEDETARKIVVVGDD